MKEVPSSILWFDEQTRSEKVSHLRVDITPSKPILMYLQRMHEGNKKIKRKATCCKVGMSKYVSAKPHFTVSLGDLAGPLTTGDGL